MKKTKKQTNIELFKKLLYYNNLIKKYLKNQITLDELKKHNIKLAMPLKDI